MVKLHRICFFIVALLFILNLIPSNVFSSDTGVTDKEIILGSSSALGGHASFLGTQLTQGSMAYFNEVNGKGGIHGRRIKMITYDDKYEPDLTIENTKKLIHQDNVFMLFDYVGTPTSKKIVRLVNEQKIPTLGLFTGAEFLRNPFQSYIINVRASYFMEVETIVDYWISNGKEDIAVFMQDDAFGTAVLAGVRLALARHNKKIKTIASFNRGELPQPEMVAKIVEAKPDAVVMVGTYTPLARFVKMAKETGLHKTQFHTVSFVGSEAFSKALLAFEADVEKNVFVTQVVPSPNDDQKALVGMFRKLYRKYYPQEHPNYVALEGFINASILVEALKRCGRSLNREKLITSLEKMSDYNAGIGLPSTISPDNHNFFEKVYISEIRGNSFELID